MRRRLGVAILGMTENVLAFFRMPNLWRGLGLMVAFWTAAMTAPFLAFYTFVNVTLIVMQIGILIAYAPGAWAAFAARKMTEGDQLVLGIWVIVLGNVLLRIWALTQKVYDLAWMLHTPLLTFIIFVILIGATLHIAGPGSSDSVVLRRNWIAVGSAFVLGGIVTLVLVLSTFGGSLLNRF